MTGVQGVFLSEVHYFRFSWVLADALLLLLASSNEPKIESAMVEKVSEYAKHLNVKYSEGQKRFGRYQNMPGIWMWNIVKGRSTWYWRCPTYIEFQIMSKKEAPSYALGMQSWFEELTHHVLTPKITWKISYNNGICITWLRKMCNMNSLFFLEVFWYLFILNKYCRLQLGQEWPFCFLLLTLMFGASK